MLLDRAAAPLGRLSPAHDGCRGCADRPARTCACCDEPAVIATLADAYHSVSWCERCWRDLQAVRGGDPREALTWWLIGKSAAARQEPQAQPDPDAQAEVA